MEVVDYLERAALELVPPSTRKPKEQWLDLIIRMKQWIPKQKPQVSRAIYSAPLSHQPSTLPEVVRQITWQAEQDRERSKDQLITWPTVTVEYYEISDDAWGRIDSTVRQLEERLGRFPFNGPETPGLSVTRPDYTLGPNLWHRRHHEIVDRNSYVRKVHLQLSWGVFHATFREGEDSDFDSAWNEAWDSLSEICRPERQVQGYEANYLLPPERLSELLVRAVTEEQP